MSQWHYSRRGVFRAAYIVMLALTVSFALTSVAMPALAQGLGAPSSTSLPSGPASPGKATSTRNTEIQAAPSSDAPFHLARVLIVLFTGFAINASRLADKFRRYLGVGLFANPYSILFTFFGAAVTGVPLISENALKGVHRLGMDTMGPWIASASGIVGTLALPPLARAGRKLLKKGSGSENGESPSTSNSNRIFLFLDNEIAVQLQLRMKKKVEWASIEYDWKMIQRAASRALVDEKAIRALDPAEIALVEKTLKEMPTKEDADKYEVLMTLLQPISYRFLFPNLAQAKAELKI